MSVTWGELFERAKEFETGHEEIERQIEASDRVETDEQSGASDRDVTGERSGASDRNDTGESERLVANVDVLVADLLVGGASREALDHSRRHTWLELVASEPLLSQAREVIAGITTEKLAEDWFHRIREERVSVSHPAGDHPALASAYRGDARHLLTFDGSLTRAETNLALQSHVDLSIRPPDAFARLFDPDGVYEHRFEEPYPGPDRDPRG